MRLPNDFQIIDTALLHVPSKTVILSDLHIGCESTAPHILIPRSHYQELQAKLERIFTATKPKQIIINGDMKHAFGRIDDEEWRHSLRIIDLCQSYGTLRVIEGNHDRVIAPILAKRGLVAYDHVQIDDVFICHGDTLQHIPQGIKHIVVGHEHCAVTISDGQRKERYKCFLVGTYEKCTLICMPSTTTFTTGTDVLQEKLLSPYVTACVKKKKTTDVYIVTSEDALHFKTLAKIEDA